MRLRMPRIDLQQMQRVRMLVPEELDVERGMIQTDLANDPVRDVRHSFGYPARNGREILVAHEAGAVFVSHRVHHPQRVGLATVAIAFESQLPAAQRLLGQADLAADGSDFGGEFEVFEYGLERGPDPTDPVSNPCQRILKLLLIGHSEGEVG